MPPKPTTLSCSIEGCARPHSARGYCSVHYQQWWKTGDPTFVSLYRDPVRRFWLNVEKTPTCWLWTGKISVSGYGVFSAGGRSQVAHRWLYEQEHGSLGSETELDHLCRVRNCVRLTHLEPVSPKENSRRGLNGILKTHCKNGHVFGGENIRIGSNGVRICIPCRERFSTPEYWREYRAKRKAAGRPVS